MLATQTALTTTVTQSCITPTLTDIPYVNLSFSVMGKSLPIDHGYGLFSALAHWKQELHHLESMSITAITGIPTEQGMMQLTDHSRLLIRLPVDKVPLVYPLAGKSLTIGKHKIHFGIPQMDFLQPAQRLRSHLVVIKSYQEPESFLEAAQRQLEQLGIQGNLHILSKADGTPKRKTIKIKRFTVVGFGLEVTQLSDEDSLTLQRKGKRCKVIMFGTVAWSSSQKTRTEIVMVEATEKLIFNYKVSFACFPENRVVEHTSGNFISWSIARGLIADNLIRGLPWWYNFSKRINKQKLFKQIYYEREGLYDMIQNGQWDQEAQKLFVQACHEALRKTFGKIYGRTKEDEYAQFQRKAERIRAELGRCKNAASFRQFITDFWARAGRISILEDHWEELLPLTTGMMDWKVARDLTLLALASYKPSKKPQTSSSEHKEPEEIAE